MSMNQQPCPIWGLPFMAEVTVILQDSLTFVENSERVGRPYRIARDGADIEIDRVSSEIKARLTTWIIDEHSKTVDWPTVTNDVLRDATEADPLSTQVRADRLLAFLIGKAARLGEGTKVSRALPFKLSEMKNPDHTLIGAMAWSESISPEEVTFLLEELIKQECIERTGPVTYVVTMVGRNRIESSAPNANSSQAFVAMWFDPTMDDVYEKGIKPAIKASGYRPLKIDESPEVDRIDDAILEQIALSKFIVVDFTHGEKGARGSVYFEAGYARALGIRAIYLCHTDLTGSLPFDTRQYKHLTWNEPEDIVEPLKEAIISRFEVGPHGT